MKRKILLTICLAILIPLIAFLIIKNQAIFRSHASAPDSPPQKVMISNVYAKGFEISWLTDKPTSGKIIFVEADNKTEKAGVQMKNFVSQADPTSWTQVHSARVSGLNPETEYRLFVCSGDDCALHKLYGFSSGQKDLTATASSNVNQGSTLPIIFKTPGEKDMISASTPIFGRVKISDMPPEAILAIETMVGAEKSALLSLPVTLVGGTGTFSFELSNSRAANLSKHLGFNREADSVKISAFWVKDGQVKTAEKVMKIKDVALTPEIIF